VLASACAFSSYARAAGAPEFFFEGDMVRGHACVLASQFKRTQAVVWRVRVLDAKTGQSVDNKGLKSLVVQLSDGQSFPLKFGDHPKGHPITDHFWAGSWNIPADYPTGSFSYKVIATDLAGAAVDWKPFDSAPSELTVVAN
jgi:hypothetical protein